MNEIQKKRIEEAELAFADREYEVGEIDHNALCKGFFHGAEYALSRQWISVDEALPEEYELVLVKHKPIASTNYYQENMSLAYIQGQGSYGLRWIINGMSWRVNRDNKNDNTVTHWMPIPKFETKK